MFDTEPGDAATRLGRAQQVVKGLGVLPLTDIEVALIRREDAAFAEFGRRHDQRRARQVHRQIGHRQVFASEGKDSGFGRRTLGKKRTCGQVDERTSCDSAAMRSATAESYYRRLNRALDFVVRRLDRPPTIEELAAEAAFSRFHFQRMFRAMTGESVTELVRRLRLERAARAASRQP